MSSTIYSILGILIGIILVFKLHQFIKKKFPRVLKLYKDYILIVDKLTDPSESKVRFGFVIDVQGSEVLVRIPSLNNEYRIVIWDDKINNFFLTERSKFSENN